MIQWGVEISKENHMSSNKDQHRLRILCLKV
jgi:hypothetical protein